jgi:Tfp pilus assembly protein PilF
MKKRYYVKAIEDCNKAICLDPRNVEAYLIRGRAYQEIGEEEKASKDWEKSYELKYHRLWKDYDPPDFQFFK